VAYEGSYIWRLRQQVGSQLLLMPGAQVVLTDGAGRVLFQRRRDNGLWELPSGAAEAGGSFRSTAVDEVREETGLLVDPADLVPFGCLSEDHVVHYPNGDAVHSFALCFETRRWSGDLTPGADEVTEAAFCAPGRRPGALHPPTSAVLDLLAAYRRTGLFQAR